MPDDSVMRLVYLGVLFAAMTGWALVELRRDFGRTAKTIAAWGLIFLGFLAAYGLWGDIRRGIRPVQEVHASTVTLPRAEDGHYYAQLTVNGARITFMADTGASDLVLSPQDAEKAGIAPGGLAYIGQAMTANGVVRTARVRLPEVTFGPFADHDVAASVNEAPMDVSLLGMSYLGRFRITIDGDRMSLTR